MNKVELYRKGEATVEKFYPPWMKVVYYRYFRFFPDGLMFMHTSPVDPVTVISQLRSPTAKLEGMCRGMYRIKDNQVGVVFTVVLSFVPRIFRCPFLSPAFFQLNTQASRSPLNSVCSLFYFPLFF